MVVDGRNNRANIFYEGNNTNFTIKQKILKKEN